MLCRYYRLLIEVRSNSDAGSAAQANVTVVVLAVPHPPVFNDSSYTRDVYVSSQCRRGPAGGGWLCTHVCVVPPPCRHSCVPSLPPGGVTCTGWEWLGIGCGGGGGVWGSEFAGAWGKGPYCP
jgi:hypothetical protein